MTDQLSEKEIEIQQKIAFQQFPALIGDPQASAFEIGRFGRPSLEEDPLNSECISARAIMEFLSQGRP
jgi:hypothetical protein